MSWPAESFAQRVRGDERFELDDRFAATLPSCSSSSTRSSMASSRSSVKRAIVGCANSS